MGTTIAPTRVDWLPNGMRVLTREWHHAPVGCVMVWYGVGSRNEGPGQTGLSHFLEHMMFKGTSRFPNGVLEEGVKRRGGMWNAFTSHDYTAYYEVLPARHLTFGLEVEADRMANMTFDPELTVRERGIIVSEREGRENSPHFWLFEAFMEAAYQVFPYRHQVLGYKEDIRATTAEALTEHYQRYYRPNNATLVVTGDFKTDEMLQAAERYFGSLPGGEAVVPPSQVEPEQMAERRVEVRRPGPNPYLTMGYKIPGADHPDHAALTILSTILSGGPSFSRGGGASMGRSSRLYRRLVSTGIASSAGAQPWALQYPGLFLCSGIPADGVTPERLEQALSTEVERIQQDLVPQDELDRAKKQVRAQFVYGMESAMNQAVLLGSTAMTQGVEHFDHAVEEFEAVSASDVQRVAQAYLQPQRRTVGWFLPEEKAAASTAAASSRTAEAAGVQDEATAAATSTPAYQEAGNRQPSPPPAGGRSRILDPDRILRRELSSGVTLVVYPTRSVPSVFVRAAMEGGAAHDPVGKAGLAQLVAQLATRGSAAFTADDLAVKTDALGISLRVDVGRETAVGTLKCLPEDLKTGLELMAQVLRHPTFPEDELGRMRDRLLVAVREAEHDTRSVASRRLSEGLYPEGHPYRRTISGTEESLRSLTRDDLMAFHSRHYGPKDAVVTVVGNVDPAQVEAAFASAFDGWQGGAGRSPIPAVPAPTGSQVGLVVPGKSQTDIAFGWALVNRKHPDHLALDVLATLYGGNGTPASSRLFRDVREKYGLSYYQYASFSDSLGPGAWTGHIGVNPSRAEFAIERVTHELRRLSEELVPEDELDALKSFLEDYPAVQHESPERVAARLAEIERFQLGWDHVERYTKLVRAVTAEQLREAAARHLSVDRLAVVTAGPA